MQSVIYCTYLTREPVRKTECSDVAVVSSILLTLRGREREREREGGIEREEGGGGRRDDKVGEQRACVSEWVSA